jgi:DNA-binding beta-propeller fold protein YncE
VEAANLREPSGLVISADGLTAWIVDNQNNRISIWTRPSQGSTQWANQTTFGGPNFFSLPFGVAVSKDGLTAYVADTGNYRISVWTRPTAGSTAWTNQTTFGTQFNLYFPYGVAVSTDGLTVWVAGNDRISVWTRPTAGSTAWTNQTTFGTMGAGASNFNNPRGVAVSTDGLTAWVADGRNNRISVWTRPTAGSTAWTNQTTFGTDGVGASNFSTPYGVYASADGLTTYVADYSNNRISIWTRPAAGSTAWTNQTTFGTVGDGPSNFNNPYGVAIAADGLTAYVSDNRNNRISIWQAPT